MKVPPRHFSYTATTASFKTIPLFVGDAKELVIAVNVTAVRGTGPTVDVNVLEIPMKEGGTPSDVELTAPAQCYREGTVMPTFTSPGSAIRHLISFTPFIKLDYAIGGTTPSFDFEVYICTR